MATSLTPNWFASVMGTGIVGVAAVSLPVHITGLHTVAVAVWLAAATLLLTLTGITLSQSCAAPRGRRGYLRDPVMAHFYGAPAMALLTVGAGTLLLGRDVLGLRVAVHVDWVLWIAGTAFGLATAVGVPYLQFTRFRGRRPSPGWLLPVVPPMVSASTGALLVPHAPPGQPRLTLLIGCYALFGFSVIASIVVIGLIWHGLVVHGVGEARTVPLLWIVLGPLGQSITAVNLLGGVAAQVLPRRTAAALQSFGLIYGLPVWGFALLWAGIAGTLTVRAARGGLPFSPAWWSFTFPIGTCVTGTSALARHTGAELFRAGAAVVYAALVLAWVVVAGRTVREVVSRGRSAPSMKIRTPGRGRRAPRLS